MVLQLQPPVVLIASKAGAGIAKETLNSKEVLFEDLWCPVVTAWGDELRPPPLWLRTPLRLQFLFTVGIGHRSYRAIASMWFATVRHHSGSG
jgi:hypothetical protein